MTDPAIDPLRQLSAPLEQLLAGGGDTRLALDPTSLLNAYGCRPVPRPEAFTFASSTATSISDRAFAAVATARQALLRDSMTWGFERAFDLRQDALRDDIKTMLNLYDTGCEVVLAPSGTDAQLLALCIARAIFAAPLTSLIAAGDETGSGAAHAARGRHFNAITAQGVAAVKGTPIAGLAADTESVAVAVRDDCGAPRAASQIEAEIGDCIAQALAVGRRALLFAMDSSKLGMRTPSPDCLRRLAASADGKLGVVVDACQVRLGRKRLRWCLDQGFMVLITGSKFFTGAPFSGALLLPQAMVARAAAAELPLSALGAYSNRSDWPEALPRARAALPARANVGQWLRWVSAVAEMGAYYAVPFAYRRLALGRFAEVVPHLIGGADVLEPLSLDDGPPDEIDDEEMAARTIFPFFVRRHGRHLSLARATKLYRALNDDVSALLPATLPLRERWIAAQRCHIGQPVPVRDRQGELSGALRVSAGARVISETWTGDIETSAEVLVREFDQVRGIVEKIGLLVRHFDDIERAYEAPHPAPSRQASAA